MALLVVLDLPHFECATAQMCSVFDRTVIRGVLEDLGAMKCAQYGNNRRVSTAEDTLKVFDIYPVFVHPHLV